ncbi:molybdate ABC transporter substrate-binding protein [Roseobacter sp. HKCCD9010]|uniref:molybdate ABC transporter substrate-binding protein n=1 Tax=unclassified Roseobacter TaxID=196798 RepID=UPI001490DB42|nr:MULTISPECIES: molybdate ABC transporter substrate-binding protein [unclassified Roseobacter]MBF9051967.1 molybdate ABC transporter substrate-binding protein [Rhodobacterales bacterium HKCCD4356]NNV44604.1 molybdate ABC transporter substrate-binding protein [Roseobacter sp. HKCCD6497]NNW72435.1 molybdate ABC transporter substrate-binding protein [Roseobacter sp. HKCCD8193]NNW89480.1 molybdate ABC transporter substrate-binding protein [Roseobacter sp. HKCCD8272]NNX15698.1 molybdate ABC transp
MISAGSACESRAIREPRSRLRLHPSLAEEVSLFAAGSLKAALSDMAADYSATHGTAVAMTFGPSGLMHDRIEAGETAHVFASANMYHPKTLEGAGRGGPVTAFARNHLCGLARPEVSVSSEALLEVMLSGNVRVGISMPKADPSGDYAFELFDKSGHADTLKRKALHLTGGADSAEPPEGHNAYAWVLDSGQADIFLTYRTNAVLAQKESPDLQIVPVPEALSVGADYGLIVLDGAPESAWTLARHIRSPAGQSVLAEHGFDTAAASEEN